MAGWRQILHFFTIVDPVPRLMKTTVWCVAACSAAVVVWDPARAVAALTPVLVLQLFATSSGFMLPARRGHYDLLLTRGHSRVRMAVVHWVKSGLPGVLAWAVVATAEIVSSGMSSRALVQAGTLTALLIVSTLPWAVTVAMPRFAGAVGWLAALALFALVRMPGEPGHPLRSIDANMPWLEVVLTLTLYPPFMVGEHTGSPAGRLLIAPIAVAVASIACACVWVQRQDIPLEASQ